MIKLHSSPNSAEIHNLKNVLEAADLPCVVRGEALAGAAGELPPNQCWIELWLLDPSREAEARALLATGESEGKPPWRCASCGESVDAALIQCPVCRHDRRTQS